MISNTNNDEHDAGRLSGATTRAKRFYGFFNLHKPPSLVHGRRQTMRSPFGLVKLLGSLALVTSLAACSGARSSDIIPQGAGADSAAQSLRSQPDSKGNCQTSGKGIHVNPCIVSWTLLNLSPQKVKIEAKKNDTVSESDDCSAQGIATISGGGLLFVATPGLIPGTCTATFSAKRGSRKLGSASLTINNQN